MDVVAARHERRRSVRPSCGAVKWAVERSPPMKRARGKIRGSITESVGCVR
jgi:hypothetical protein